jgi:hypothetical protein
MLPSACEVPTEVCCTSMYDIAEHILTNVFDTLNDCMAQTECEVGQLLAYVTMGEGDDGNTDSLTVEFSGAQPSPTAQASPNHQLAMSIYQATFSVRLRESGWPVAQAGGYEVTPPDPAKQNTLARHAFAHGELMYRKLISMKLNRCMVPSCVPGCGNVRIGQLAPLRPTAGVVGFVATVTIDMPWSGG